MFILKVNFPVGKLEQVSQSETELLTKLDKYKKEGYNGSVVKLEANNWDEYSNSLKKEFEDLYRNSTDLH